MLHCIIELFKKRGALATINALLCRTGFKRGRMVTALFRASQMPGEGEKGEGAGGGGGLFVAVVICAFFVVVAVYCCYCYYCCSSSVLFD